MSRKNDLPRSAGRLGNDHFAAGTTAAFSAARRFLPRRRSREMRAIDRFPSVGHFLSYARLVTPQHTSDGKRTGGGGTKIGNVRLKWAFSEVVPLMMREYDQTKKFVQRKERKHGKSRAMTMLARKIGRAVYQMLKRKEAFDTAKFFANSCVAGGGAARITQVTYE